MWKTVYEKAAKLRDSEKKLREKLSDIKLEREKSKEEHKAIVDDEYGVNNYGHEFDNHWEGGEGMRAFNTQEMLMLLDDFNVLLTSD